MFIPTETDKLNAIPNDDQLVGRPMETTKRRRRKRKKNCAIFIYEQQKDIYFTKIKRFVNVNHRCIHSYEC